MRKEYDFTGGKRGAVVPKGARKVRITIRLDADVVEYFKGLALEDGGGSYQGLINGALRRHMENVSPPVDEDSLRRILREELSSRTS